MSYVNLMSNDVWTEADIVNRGRAIINEQVPEARQNELRTIMLGHIAQMRLATPEELAEIAQVQQVTEAVVLTNAASREDMKLLLDVMEYEKTLARLLLAPITEPAQVLTKSVLDDEPYLVPNPVVVQDAAERQVALGTVNLVSDVVKSLYDLRHPNLESV